MKTLLVFLLVFNSHYLIAQDLYPVWNSYFRDTVCNSEYRGNCGYKNIKNEIAIPLKYCRCGTFYNNLAIVEINGLKGMIDTNNRLIIPIKYAKIVGFNTIIPYSEKSLKTLFIARKTVSDDSGFIYNLAGEVVFKGRFSDAYSITDKNLILLENKNPYPYSKDNKYTIDLFDYQFKILFSLKSNTYIAFYSLSFNQYNTQNYNPEKSYITITKVLNENDFKLRTCAIYNLNGKLIFDSSAIDEHHIKWNKEGQIKWRMFSKNVSFPNQTMAIIDSDFHYIIPFSSGYQKIKNGYLTNAYYEFTKNGNTWGLMDSNLNVLCADKYVDIRKVDSLLVGFYENNKTADVDVYNLKGAFQYTINYQDLQKKLQYRPIITYTENELKAQKFANGPIVYDYGGKYGLVDSNCKFLVEPIYSHINVAGKYYLVHNRYETNTGVFIKHRYGILNQKGVFVVDMNYDNITYTDGKKYFLMEKKENPIPDIYVIEQ